MSSDLQNKMLQWEAKPPEEAWNRIAASLDADEEYVLSQKLSLFESQPPQHVWEHIESELGAYQPGRVVSFYQKHKRALKYSGAAAAVLFVAILINLSVSKPSVSNELTHQSGIQSLPSNQNASSSADKSNADVPSNIFSDSQEHTRQQSTQISEEEITGNPDKQSSNTAHKSGKTNRLIAEWEQAKDSLVNRYFVHTNQKGEAIRFSSKLYDLFECSEEWTESECAQQIRLWQKKAATSALYASADFTGVLEVLKAMTNDGNNEY